MRQVWPSPLFCLSFSWEFPSEVQWLPHWKSSVSHTWLLQNCTWYFPNTQVRPSLYSALLWWSCSLILNSSTTTGFLCFSTRTSNQMDLAKSNEPCPWPSLPLPFVLDMIFFILFWLLSPFPHPDFPQMLRLRYSYSPRFRLWSSMFDNEKGPVAKRVPRAAENAAGLTLLCSLSLSLAWKLPLEVHWLPNWISSVLHSWLIQKCTWYFLIPQIYLNFS